MRAFADFADIALAFLISILLAGCASMTPYVAARHQSDPGIEDDGRDLGCAGFKKRGQLSVKAGWCYDVEGDDMAEFEIEYELIGERND